MYIKFINALLAVCLLANINANAQEDEKKDGKKQTYISLGPTNGLVVGTEKDSTVTREKEKTFSVSFGVVDIGLNSLQDKTDYTSAAAGAFLNVPNGYQNENLFDLNTGKSWNVNVYPVLASWTAHNGKKQKVVFGTGIGLQMYNFRFNKPVTYVNTKVPEVYLDTVRSFSKNKLGMTYLSVPLMMTFKTKAGNKTWLLYGVGITGGYRLASYMKQVTTQDGKEKDHNKFNFSDFNSCVTAEFGLEGYFRLYASYQLTALHETILDQHPFCIGLRIGGI
ncbi:MAG: outer membrane beta-barrel protein [Chitinophagales bacterium]|nr:outer membrane beta-barrel protein [Chitinophagaceae bacterium]MCB9065406.1 outer membrane beta-barrel protein [Chitinophagales bacterium]